MVFRYKSIDCQHIGQASLEGALRGRREAIVRSAQDLSMCGYPFRVGETYLIYGYIDPSGALLTSYCWRTKHISEASYDLEELRKIVGE